MMQGATDLQIDRKREQNRTDRNTEIALLQATMQRHM